MDRILLIGDPHFKVGNKIQTDQLHAQVLQYLHENQVDFVVILGDILDTHEKINMGPFCRAMEMITDISKLKKVYLQNLMFDLEWNIIIKK